MCLIVHKTLTAQLKRKKGKVVCYKALTLSRDSEFDVGKLNAPIRSGIEYKPGIAKSDYDHSKHKNQAVNGSVSNGIHVYVDKKTAVKRNSGNSRVVVPVECDWKDFIAAGGYNSGEKDHYVFKKVFLKKEDHEEAVTPPKPKFHGLPIGTKFEIDGDKYVVIQISGPTTGEMRNYAVCYHSGAGSAFFVGRIRQYPDDDASEKRFGENAKLLK